VDVSTKIRTRHLKNTSMNRYLSSNQFSRHEIRKKWDSYVNKWILNYPWLNFKDAYEYYCQVIKVHNDNIKWTIFWFMSAFTEDFIVYSSQNGNIKEVENAHKVIKNGFFS
jgi:hypothetical protein